MDPAFKLAEIGLNLFLSTKPGTNVKSWFLGQLCTLVPWAAPLQLGLLTHWPFGRGAGWPFGKGAIEVETLKGALKDRSHLFGNICCSGTYMPGSLLISGWWERAKQPLASVKWADIPGVQSWLWNGFEQWAPSWDTNLWHEGNSSSILLGQIGTHDEADSIPVIIEAGEKARQVREEMTALISSKGRLVSNAVIQGQLMNRKQLLGHSNRDIQRLAKELTNAGLLLKNCIVVGNNPSNHRVDLRTNEHVELYSGYLWKCVCPKVFVDNQDARVVHSYVAWEHTNFANRDAINYNLDALDHKLVYIAEKRKHGGSRDDLSLLQHMMPQDRLRGDPGGTGYEIPEISMDEFMEMFPRQGA
jgi:hypothetical protein